jgi:hypothetical protein
LGASYGQFPIIVTGVNTYQIPQIITTAITGGYSYGEGSIQVIADSTVIADCIFQGDLNSTCSLIYSTINSPLTNPKYKIINLIDSIVPGFKTFTIQAPNDTGNTWNGKLLTLQTTGSIIATPNSTLFTGGLNQREEFLNYDFNTLPNSIMKYWGTKRLAWDTFEDFEFQKAYAHTWDMYDYHNDWLGGFDLYSLQYGDKVRITKDSNGLVFGETDSPPNNYLDLSEAKNQLHDSIDDNINVTSAQGVKKVMRIVGIFSSGNKAVDESKSYIHIATAQQLVQRSSDYVTDIYVSTINPDIALNFGENTQGQNKRGQTIIIQVLVKRGAKGMYVDDYSATPGEGEFLLPRGSSIKLTAGPNKLVGSNGYTGEMNRQVIFFNAELLSNK